MKTPMLPPASVDPRPRLLIVGCSTRAAAWSAVRAGFRPVCADQFGDEDLRQVAEVLPVDDYPQSLAGDVSRTTAAAWTYSGGMENALSAVTSIEASHRFLGPLLGGAAVDLVTLRDPLRLQWAAAQAGLATTPVCTIRRPSRRGLATASCGDIPWEGRPPADGTWLSKPILGGGGLGIERYTSAVADWSKRAERPVYYQQFVPGTPVSAMFVARWDQVECLGWTQQLIGEAGSAAPTPFAYCGNIGPIAVPIDIWAAATRAAADLVDETGFRGLFGLDGILAADGLHLIEVNPRYTASCELLELAQRRPLLTEHWNAFLGDRNPAPAAVELPSFRTPPLLGKLILYARGRAVAPDLSRFLGPRSAWSVPFLADIPGAGTRFEAGQPMCTVYASGRSINDVCRKLDRRADRVRRWFNVDNAR